MTEIRMAFVCANCGHRYKYDDDAIKCCPIEIWTEYFCPVCDDAHGNEQAARACCNPDAPEPPPTAAELEAMGQLRMIE